MTLFNCLKTVFLLLYIFNLELVINFHVCIPSSSPQRLFDNDYVLRNCLLKQCLPIRVL